MASRTRAQLTRELDQLRVDHNITRRLCVNMARMVAVLEHAKSGSGGFAYTPSYGGAQQGDADGTTELGVRNNPLNNFKDLSNSWILGWFIRGSQL